jgi:myo-inositol-1(or 4)-monophosphatase
MSNISYTPEDMTASLIDSVVDNIKSIFVELGPEIVAKSGNSSFITKKDGSPVTEVDGQIENKIIQKLNKKFPRLIVYGEEGGYSEDFPEVCLLIDPIDGTKSFIKAVPSFTNMAVLLVNNEAIASVIYNPSTKNIFTAIKNKGAFKNDIRLNLNNVALPKTAISKKLHMNELSKITDDKNISLQTSPSGGGYGFCKVAEGLEAARFQINAGGYIHDYAPGALLVREAGGEIISLEDNNYTINSRSFIACHPDLKVLFEDNIKTLKEYKKSFR